MNFATIEVFPPLAVPLAIVFALYVSLIVLFAVFYHRLFRSDPESYSFASSLVRTQSAVFAARAEKELAEGHRVLELLAEARVELETVPQFKPKSVDPFSFVGRWQADLRQMQITLERRLPGSALGGPIAALHTVKIALPSGESYSRTFDEAPLADVRLRRLIDLWFTTIQTEQASWQERLATLGSTSPTIWNFVDFLYFSVITQTTVGYGDILPNCTRVRLLVSLQILLGYALLVVVVNLVLSSAT